MFTSAIQLHELLNGACYGEGFGVCLLDVPLVGSHPVLTGDHLVGGSIFHGSVHVLSSVLAFSVDSLCVVEGYIQHRTLATH